MSFKWEPSIPDEQPEAEPLSVWLFVVLFIVIELAALLMTGLSWSKGNPVVAAKLARDVIGFPLMLWLFISASLHLVSYSKPALHIAISNACRWTLLNDWQQSSRRGIAVLDSVVLTPEPTLALRMLGLEGTAPVNPGRVMALDDVVATEDITRESALVEKLMAPLVAQLVRAARDGSFEVVVQCDRAEIRGVIETAWERLALPNKPRIRRIDNSREIDFAEIWFEDDHRTIAYTRYYTDHTPKYRLLLAWHLSEAGQTDAAMSEAAVALLVGSPALMRENNRPRPQAWLLRQIVGDADQVDKSLSLLLKAEQVPADRIHHFWHARLKGLAQHATMGAVSDSGLKVAAHDLEQAVGLQAPVARWVMQALAAQMAHYGQGAQLVALPREQGVALNFVAKEPLPVDLPWKESYESDLFPGAEFVACLAFWMLFVALSPGKEWGMSETILTGVAVIAVILGFAVRLLGQRTFVKDFWNEYRGQT